MGNSKNHIEVKYSYFAVILYEEDPKHMEVMNYILSHKDIFQKVLYIYHDKDKYDKVDNIENEFEDKFDDTKHNDGDLKKPHYHVMFKFCKATSTNAILSHFLGVLNYCAGINNFVIYGHYMIHDTYAAIKEGKYQYEICELKGDKDFKKQIFIQNTNTVEFLNILKTVKQEINMFDVFDKFEREEKFEEAEFCLKHCNLLLQMQNQLYNNNKKRLQDIKEAYELYGIEKRYILNAVDSKDQIF